MGEYFDAVADISPSFVLVLVADDVCFFFSLFSWACTRALHREKVEKGEWCVPGCHERREGFWFEKSMVRAGPHHKNLLSQE